jgi:ATP-dependent helicase YprA (DUF1998 family)
MDAIKSPLHDTTTHSIHSTAADDEHSLASDVHMQSVDTTLNYSGIDNDEESFIEPNKEGSISARNQVSHDETYLKTSGDSSGNLNDDLMIVKQVHIINTTSTYDACINRSI